MACSWSRVVAVDMFSVVFRRFATFWIGFRFLPKIVNIGGEKSSFLLKNQFNVLVALCWIVLIRFRPVWITFRPFGKPSLGQCNRPISARKGFFVSRKVALRWVMACSRLSSVTWPVYPPFLCPFCATLSLLKGQSHHLQNVMGVVHTPRYESLFWVKKKNTKFCLSAESRGEAVESREKEEGSSVSRDYGYISKTQQFPSCKQSPRQSD